jgi:hypothetical protein
MRHKIKSNSLRKNIYIKIFKDIIVYKSNIMVRKTIADYYFYKLICIDDNVELEYIGSTTNWKQRNSHHKSACNNPDNKDHNNKKYQIIRANGGWNNWRMLEIGRKEQLTLREAQLIEEEYRQTHRAKLNSRKCYATQEGYQKEYRETHREELAEYHKDYYNKKKDEINEKRKEKVECKVCNCMVSRSVVARHYNTPKHKKNMGTQTEN